MLDGLHTDGRGNVGLAGSGAANQHDIVGILQEVAAMELAHQCLVDLAAGEVEAIEVAIGGEACGLELVGRRSHLSLCRLGLEQLRQDWDGGLEGGSTLLGQLAHGLSHAVHLEAFEHDDNGAGGGVMTHDGSPRLCAARRSARHWPLAPWSAPEPGAH